eukprot:PhM_4_TR14745/c0_g1_i1/m.15186
MDASASVGLPAFANVVEDLDAIKRRTGADKGRSRFYIPPAASSFDVYLPRKQLRKFDEGQTTLIVKQKLQPRVLIIDKNRIAAAACQIVLEHRHCSARFACSAKEALHVLETDVFDVIIMALRVTKIGTSHSKTTHRKLDDVERLHVDDVDLMDGIELTERIRAVEALSGNHVPIFLSLGIQDDEPGTWNRALEAGVDRYIIKPSVHHMAYIATMFVAGGNCTERFRLRVVEEGLSARYLDICEVFDTTYLEEDEMRAYMELLQKERFEMEAKSTHTISKLTDRIRTLQSQLHEMEREQRPRTPLEEKIAVAMERWKANSGTSELKRQIEDLQTKIDTLEELCEQYRKDIRALITNPKARRARMKEYERQANGLEGDDDDDDMDMVSEDDDVRPDLREQYEMVCMAYEDHAASRLWSNYAHADAESANIRQDPTSALPTSWFASELREIHRYVTERFYGDFFSPIEQSYSMLRTRASTMQDVSFRTSLYEAFATMTTEIEKGKEAARRHLDVFMASMVHRELELWQHIYSNEGKHLREYVPEIFRPHPPKKPPGVTQGTQYEDPEADEDSTFITTQRQTVSSKTTMDIVKLREETEETSKEVSKVVRDFYDAFTELSTKASWRLPEVKVPPPPATPPTSSPRGEVLATGLKYLTAVAANLRTVANDSIALSQLMPPPPASPIPPSGSLRKAKSQTSTRVQTPADARVEPVVPVVAIEGMFPDREVSIVSLASNQSVPGTARSLGRGNKSGGASTGAQSNRGSDHLSTSSVEAVQPAMQSPTSRHDSSVVSAGFVISDEVWKPTEDDNNKLDQLTMRVETLTSLARENSNPAIAQDLQRASEDRAYMMMMGIFQRRASSISQDTVVGRVVHTTVENETVAQVAKAYHCDVELLHKHNPTLKRTSSGIVVRGTELTVPVTATSMNEVMDVVHKRHFMRRDTRRETRHGSVVAMFSIDSLRRVSAWYQKQTALGPLDRMISSVLLHKAFAGHGQPMLEHAVSEGDSLKALCEYYQCEADSIRNANPFVVLPTRLETNLKGYENLAIPISHEGLNAALELLELRRTKEAPNIGLSERDIALCKRVLQEETEQEYDNTTNVVQVMHLVDHGDSIRSVSRSYGCAAETVYQLNPSISRDIKPGVPLDTRKHVALTVAVDVNTVLKAIGSEHTAKVEKYNNLVASSDDVDESPESASVRSTLQSSIAMDNTMNAVLEVARKGGNLTLSFPVRHTRLPCEEDIEIAHAYDVRITELNIPDEESEVVTVNVPILVFYEKLCVMRNKCAQAVFDCVSQHTNRFSLFSKAAEATLLAKKSELLRYTATTSFIEKNLAAHRNYDMGMLRKQTAFIKRAVIIHGLFDDIMKLLPPTQLTKTLLALRQGSRDEEWYMMRELLLGSSIGNAKNLVDLVDPHAMSALNNATSFIGSSALNIGSPLMAASTAAAAAASAASRSRPVSRGREFDLPSFEDQTHHPSIKKAQLQQQHQQYQQQQREHQQQQHQQYQQQQREHQQQQHQQYQ